MVRDFNFFFDSKLDSLGKNPNINLLNFNNIMTYVTYG